MNTIMNMYKQPVSLDISVKIAYKPVKEIVIRNEYSTISELYLKS